MDEQAIRYGDIEIKPMTYVDDIIALGNESTITKTIRNCRQLEEEKKMTFNCEKSNFQIIKFSNKVVKPIQENLKNGIIKATDTYKYLGHIITSDARYDKTISSRTTKKHYITATIKSHANKTGFLYIRVVNKLYKAIALPMITYNTETWSNLTTNKPAVSAGSFTVHY